MHCVEICVWPIYRKTITTDQWLFARFRYKILFSHNCNTLLIDIGTLNNLYTHNTLPAIICIHDRPTILDHTFSCPNDHKPLFVLICLFSFRSTPLNTRCFYKWTAVPAPAQNMNFACLVYQHQRQY